MNYTILEPGVDLAPAGEYLTFRLGAEEYGIGILKVQEIRSYEVPTRIANAPPFVRGVTNLRSLIVPIVDLRIKLGCPDAGFDASTVVVVLNLQGGSTIGVVVDSVSDVLDLESAAIKPAPSMVSQVASSFITGIGSVQDDRAERTIILLDVESLLSSSSGPGFTHEDRANGSAEVAR